MGVQQKHIRARPRRPNNLPHGSFDLAALPWTLLAPPKALSHGRPEQKQASLLGAPLLLPQPPSPSRGGGVPTSVAVFGVSDDAEVDGDAAGDHHLRRPTCQEVAGKRRSPWKTVFPPWSSTSSSSSWSSTEDSSVQPGC